MGIKGLRTFVTKYILSNMKPQDKQEKQDKDKNTKQEKRSCSRYIPNKRSQDITYTTNNKTYISKSTYIDITSYLIQYYIAFANQFKDKPQEQHTNLIPKLTSFVSKKLVSLINKLGYNNKKLYIFSDVHNKDIIRWGSCTMFRDIILNKTFTKEELQCCRYVIKRNWLKTLLKMSSTVDTEQYVLTHNDYDLINNMFRESYLASSIAGTGNAISEVFSITDYINMRYVRREYYNKFNNRAKKMFDILELMLIDEFVLYKSGKMGEIKRRHKRYTAEENFPSVGVMMYLLPDIIYDVLEYIKNNIQKSNENGKFKRPVEVTFFRCELEADFALALHIKTYNKRALSVVETVDSDMLCLLNDVSCVVNLKHKIMDNEVVVNEDGTTDVKHVLNNNYKDSFYQIKPIEFWEYIFGYKLPSRVIKILCVLMGTDYNPYHKSSKIHISTFEDILTRLNVSSFSKLTEEMLLLHLYELFKNNMGDRDVSGTIIALNIYLNDNIEQTLHEFKLEPVRYRRELAIKEFEEQEKLQEFKHEEDNNEAYKGSTLRPYHKFPISSKRLKQATLLMHFINSGTNYNYYKCNFLNTSVGDKVAEPSNAETSNVETNVVKTNTVETNNVNESSV